MTGCLRGITLALSCLVWGLVGSPSALAQVPFNSGSTGVLGALNPTSNTAIALPPDGVLNYTTVNIPAGVTLTFTSNASNTPVTLLASGNVTIVGTVSVNGFDGVPQSSTGPTLNVGALGGPGGFAGGNGGQRGTNDSGTTGQGPGGGPGCASVRATMLRKGMAPIAPICPLCRSSHSSAGPEEEEPVQILRRDRR